MHINFRYETGYVQWKTFSAIKITDKEIIPRAVLIEFKDFNLVKFKWYMFQAEHSDVNGR